MAIFNKLTKNIPDMSHLYRFCNSSEAWNNVKPKNIQRTTQQLCDLIDNFAEQKPVMKEFVADLKAMNPKHLSLAADTMELASTHPLVHDAAKVHFHAVDPQSGKSLIQLLLKAIPKASKENPQALEFMQEVINCTDRKTIEYVLMNLLGVIDKPHLGEHLRAVKPMVKEIAQQTVGDGFPRLDFEKEERFMQFIRALVNRNNSPEKIAALPKLTAAIDKIPSNIDVPVELNKFTMSNAPLKQVEENIELVPEVMGNALNQGKQINVVDFVNNNVNLY